MKTKAKLVWSAREDDVREPRALKEGKQSTAPVGYVRGTACSTDDGSHCRFYSNTRTQVCLFGCPDLLLPP